MDYNKVEDAVLKKAMDIFKDNAVKFFGIATKILSPAETEIKNVDIKTNYTDYLFYTEDGEYLHFEFQTTDKKDNIKRFLYYDASLFYKEKRKVKTIVVYSADIENVETFVDAGTIKYNIEAFYMKNIDGDEKLQYLKSKIERNEQLTGEDIVNLSFIPLMRGKDSRSKRTLDSIELAGKIPDENDKLQCLSLLYALFDKFGDEISKIKFKEMISMTEIGKMLREDGIKEGLKEGKADILIKLLIKKFNILPEEYKKKLKSLPEETIDIIATEIFDLQELKELEKYFV